MNSAKQICVIAEALGPQRTREELLPFLAGSGEDEDEVLVAMAQQFGRMGNLVGGPEYLHLLILPLEAFVSADEAAVRNAALESIKLIAGQMPIPSLLAHVVPTVQV